VALKVGGVQQLTATVAPNNAANKAVSWVSSNPAVASVDASGKVTARAAGTATITVKTADGAKTATVKVTVSAADPPLVKVTGVSVSPTTVALKVGGVQQLTATVAPANAANKTVTWTSSNPAVASVDAKGKVTAKAAGKATITVRTADGAKTATVVVTVSAAAPPPVCVPYTDVPPSHVFYASVCWAQIKKITFGTGDGTTYSPNNPVTRGSMAAFLYRLAGSPRWTPPAVSPFVDVDSSHMFYHSITWLADQKITVGTMIGGKLYYQPANAVTRGSMAAFIRRMAGGGAASSPVNPFADLTKANQFYDAILWLAETKITYGAVVDGKLVYGSSNPVTRGSMAAFLSRLSIGKYACNKYPGAVGC